MGSHLQYDFPTSQKIFLRKYFSTRKKCFFNNFLFFHRTYPLGLLHLKYELLTPKTRKVTSEKPKNCTLFFILSRSEDENRENAL